MQLNEILTSLVFPPDFPMSPLTLVSHFNEPAFLEKKQANKKNPTRIPLYLDCFMIPKDICLQGEVEVF